MRARRARRISREFPDHAATWTDPVTRREFMTLIGTSLALAGASGCNMREPNELIIPYVRKPEQETPGQPLFYATAMPHDGAAIGLLVESHAGRPTKIEGNPQHPGSRGATDAFCQASILTLYDPDRSKSLRYLGRIRGWNDALTELQKEMSRPGGLRETKGRGFGILSEVITSPALAAQREALLRTFPELVGASSNPHCLVPATRALPWLSVNRSMSNTDSPTRKSF